MGGITIDIQSGVPSFSVYVYSAGTTTPVLYEYSGINGFNSTGIKYLSNIDPGIYDIKVVDSHNCTVWIYNVSSSTDRLDGFLFEIFVYGGETVTLPLSIGYTYNFTVDWGDGSATDEIISYNSVKKTHTYNDEGYYTISIFGTCQSFAVNNTYPIRIQIQRVLRWGSSSDFRQLNFYGCPNLTTIPDGPITGCENITTFLNFMRGCVSYTTIHEDLFALTTNATIFDYAFEESGVTGVLPENLFKYNVNATNFKSTFRSTQFTSDIPKYLFKYNVNAVDFTSTFAYSPFTGDIPVELFETCILAQYFTGTFAYCNYLGTGGGSTGIIPDYLFWYNTEVIDFNQTFRQCIGLTYGYTSNLFTNNTKVKSFYGTFWECWNIIQSIPEDMFYNNIYVTDFSYCFGKNEGLTGTIPTNLFRYNTGVTKFVGTFYGAGNKYGYLSGEIPADLFRYNVEATDFSYCFRWQLALSKAPNGLFKYNTKANNFYQTFNSCMNLQIEQYVFSDSTPESAYNRFSGETVNFRETFSLNEYYGSQRYAPELWDSEVYGGLTVSNYTDCYQMTDCDCSSVYSNCLNIPVEWQ